MNATEFVAGLLSLVRKADKGPRKPMKVQSLIFSKDRFKSAADAKAWASKHNFIAGAVDETGQSYRIRQQSPGKFKKMRTIEMTDGVKAVVGKCMPGAGVSKISPTRSDVHVPAAGTEQEIPAQHKQPVRLKKDDKGRVVPSKTAAQLHRDLQEQHGHVGGTIRTGSRAGSDTVLDGSDQGSTERFVFGPMVFDIDKAREMGGLEANATVAVSPDWSHMINVDTNAALQSTSENPVMIAQVPTTNGVEQLLIDGHHRMHKAMHDGKDELPAHVFSPDETLELVDTPPALKDKMRAHLSSSSPTVSTKAPGDGKTVGRDLPEDKMRQARQDVDLLSDPAIELETAQTWAARAIAAYEQGDEARAEEYGHEALEHAALVKDGGSTAGKIETDLRKAGLYGKIEKAYTGTEGERAAAADLVTLPKGEKVDNCTNCKFVEKDYCAHPRMMMALKSGADRMCCSYWDREGVVHEGQVSKDTEEGSIGDLSYTSFSNSGARSSGGMGDNALAGLYDMQQIIDGMDWELAHETASPEMAKEVALSNLEDDPSHYRKLRMQEEGVDWGTGWGIENTAKGLKLDLGSGPNREPGHIGIDLVKHDYGTAVHDLHLGIPVPDGSASHVLVRNALEYMDELSTDPKPLLSEIQRVLMPGGQFVYEGPNQIQNQPEWLKETWSEQLSAQQSRAARDAGDVTKIEGKPMWRQEFARVASPDPATTQDSEPRIGVAQYDMLPADALLAMDALGYYWSDATSSGRGNRLHGYPSQGALVKAPADAAIHATFEENPPQPDSVTDAGPGRAAKGGPGSGRHAEGGADKDRKANERKLQMLRDQADRDRARYEATKKALSGRQISICKADQAKQVVYGVVLAPEEFDLQEDWMRPEEIEKTAHFFMMNGRTIGKAHETVCKAIPVESYIAPQDLQFTGQYGDQHVKKGSWVLGVKVIEPSEWQKVVDGEYTGFSVGGWGQRTDSQGPDAGQKQW